MGECAEAQGRDSDPRSRSEKSCSQRAGGEGGSSVKKKWRTTTTKKKKQEKKKLKTAFRPKEWQRGLWCGKRRRPFPNADRVQQMGGKGLAGGGNIRSEASYMRNLGL